MVLAIGMLITAILASVFHDSVYLILQKHMHALHAGTGSQLSATELLTSFCFTVESIHNDTVYIRNCGSERIFNETLMVYVDGKLSNFMTDVRVIEPHEVMGIFIRNISTGEHLIKITNGIVSEETRMEIK